MKKYITTLFFAALFCALSSHAVDIKISNAWARASSSSTSAVYMEIENNGKKDVVLDKVTGSEDLAKIIELHKTVTENNVSQMVHIDKLLIPAGQKVILAPKGIHIMLMGLQQHLLKNQQITLELYFSDKERIRLNIEVK